MNKKGYDFSFGWIFAIIVGAVIIFLAIYATTQIIDTQRSTIGTIRAKRIGILLTPVETNLEQAKLATILVPQETRLFADCSEEGDFGTQRLSSLVKSGIGGDWQPDPGVESSFKNKYIFSTEEIRAKKEFYIFTKPFKFPFKIADITMVWPDTTTYCFVFSSSGSATQNLIKEELENIAPKNVLNVTSLTECPPIEGIKTVCFGNSDCDVSIELNSKRVYYKSGEDVKYAESLDSQDKFALLFAAIFSDKQTYECQVSRLAKRAERQADLYKAKSRYLTPKGCRSSPLLPAILESYQSSLSSGIFAAENEASDLKLANGNLDCALF